MKSILLATALLIGVQSFAQKKEKKPKEDEKFFYTDATFETDDYKVYITDGVAVGPFSKFKMKVFNKTNDYLVIKTSEIGYVSDAKTVANKEKDFVVAPNDEDWKVIDFKGSEMQTNKYTVDLKGIYKVSANGQITETPVFDLPPTKNDFTTGNFTCSLKKHEANTDASTSKFECTYTGDGIGIINAYKAAAIMPNKTENANSKKNKAVLLEKGKKDDFTLVFKEIIGAGDLQKKAIQVKWNDTFRESKLVKLDATKIEVVKDEVKTAEKK